MVVKQKNILSFDGRDLHLRFGSLPLLEVPVRGVQFWRFPQDERPINTHTLGSLLRHISGSFHLACSLLQWQPLSVCWVKEGVSWHRKGLDHRRYSIPLIVRGSLRARRAGWSSLNAYTMCKHKDSNYLQERGVMASEFILCRALSVTQLAPKVFPLRKAASIGPALLASLLLCLHGAPRKSTKEPTKQLGFTFIVWASQTLSQLTPSTSGAPSEHAWER